MVKFLLNPVFACPEPVEPVEGEVGGTVFPPLNMSVPPIVHIPPGQDWVGTVGVVLMMGAVCNAFC